jgi:hypothetical protein
MADRQHVTPRIWEIGNYFLESGGRYGLKYWLDRKRESNSQEIMGRRAISKQMRRYSKAVQKRNYWQSP